MNSDLVTIYDRLVENCRRENFAGWDPFDGLESAAFKLMPMRGSRTIRLAWQQMVKRSPVNLRPLLGVPKGVNAKGVALFALAALSRYRVTGEPDDAARVETLMVRLRELMISDAEHNARSWFSYPFDWQSRAFYAPKGTPTIVPTAFSARAFAENYELFGVETDREALSSIARFILKDLNRTYETETEICFSYTPLDSTRIYNASLLSAEVLAQAGTLTEDGSLSETSERAVRFVLNGQRNDGSWLYGPGDIHVWVDNFHTAFILDSLRRISETKVANRQAVESAIERGFEYWLDNFFLPDGTPKYFDKRTYPVDIHAAAAAIATLSGFEERDERALPLARQIAEWTVGNLIGPDGNTYYQMRKYFTVKTPFMRWGQAWTAYALALLIEAESKAEAAK